MAGCCYVGLHTMATGCKVQLAVGCSDLGKGEEQSHVTAYALLLKILTSSNALPCGSNLDHIVLLSISVYVGSTSIPAEKLSVAHSRAADAVLI